MKNFVQSGEVLDLTAPSGGVTSGLAVKIGSVIAIAAVTAAASEEFAAAVTGVFDVAAATSQAWTQGALVYWDDTAKVFTTTASTNQKAGVAVAIKDSAAATGRVRLIPTV